MKKIMILMLMAFFVAGSLQAIDAPDKKNFLGEWKFESPHAPEGYQKGIFIIQEQEGKLAGEIRFGDQYKVEMKDMKLADDVLKFGINVDYTYVEIKTTVEGDKMKGTAASPEGDMPFEAKKIIKEQ